MPIGDSETIQMVDTTALPPGSDFGTRYRIEGLLGQGGMGRVYKAYDKDLDRTVALKVVRHGVMGEVDALKRFKQELVLASKISHKNILRIHDMGEVGDVKFITMAYVEGQDLHGILRDNPKLPLERVLKFATQLADALAAAHGEGVVHRDLKPQNILVNKDDQIFVSDFGLAKSFEEGAIGMTRTGAFLGTPRYMSPEQVEGKPADQRSDLYAYGLIVYEMVTGDVPFTGETTLKVMYQRIQEKPKSPKLVNPSLPNWLVRLIMRCLEKDPADRYQSAYEILADLQGSKSSSSTTRTVHIEIPEFAQRRWTWYVGGVALLLGLAFAIPPVRHLILGVKGGSGVSGIPPLSQGKFVAILPFRVLGDDQSLSYVAEGLNEALSAKLFQLKEVRLASDTAVAKVSDKDPIEKTARNLGVNLIVQGKIQGTSDKMAVIVNLMDPVEGKKVWTQQFTGTAKDLLSIEDQISTQLVTALNVKASSEEMARAAERPTDNVDAYDLYLRGRQALRGPDVVKSAQKSIDLFEQGIKKDPTFALAYSGLADASLTMYREKKDAFWAQKALSAAQHAEQLKDSIPEVHFSLGSVYLRTGKTPEAIAEFKRGLQLAPNSDEGYVRLGNAHMEGGQKEEAISAYKKAIEVNPYYWGHHIVLGNAYWSLGANDKALEEFKRVTELDPENVRGWDNLGNAYSRLAKYDESITAYQKSLQLDPTYWSAYSNLGNSYFLMKRYADAVQAFEKAIELGPNQEIAFGNLADAYRASGQKDKAMATYDKAIALAFQDLQVNPQNTGAMADLALYYAKRGDAKHGMDYIQRARGIDKKDVGLIYNQAIVENLAGKPSEALRTLREAFSKGYPVKEAQADPELANLQNLPEFQALVKQFTSPDH
ncbi:MAG TPA: tetratricopeptide repeat protein [Candidatus Limnocylindria bacterium]|nr:tetratricopeptide repeat protein [Candidatus Limnocylindria bacterium]